VISTYVLRKLLKVIELNISYCGVLGLVFFIKREIGFNVTENYEVEALALCFEYVGVRFVATSVSQRSDGVALKLGIFRTVVYGVGNVSVAVFGKCHYRFSRNGAYLREVYAADGTLYSKNILECAVDYSYLALRVDDRVGKVDYVPEYIVYFGLKHFFIETRLFDSLRVAYIDKANYSRRAYVEGQKKN
jgi:hypothetical protein